VHLYASINKNTALLFTNCSIPLVYYPAFKLSSTHAGKSPLFWNDWGSMHMLYRRRTGRWRWRVGIPKKQSTSEFIKWKSVIISWTMQNCSTNCHTHTHARTRARTHAHARAHTHTHTQGFTLLDQCSKAFITISTFKMRSYNSWQL
jgi:hypothetical protein